ncbi:MAG: ATP-binding protein, partial [Cyclobacteriaceae bacterium]|nr:ATP-binding protein [Cyclobacteriaceae bacterium]
MYTRAQKENILKQLKSGFVVVLYGARRTGKTVLLNDIRQQMAKGKVLSVVGEDLDVAEILTDRRISTLSRFVDGYKYLFIDEAQVIPNVGATLKLMVDSIEGLHVFITGSSALDLYGQAGEPLTGRSIFLKLFPLSLMELGQNLLELKRDLEQKLIYGLYPQVVMASPNQEKKQVLQSIKNGYLLKDLLTLENVKDAAFVLDLLRLLAFQIGSDVSASELARQLKVNVRTVQRYLDILEKTFVIFSLRGYSKNLRKEISKSPRYYFWDNGIRNTVISNYNEIKMRDDVGRLWENFCISERMKWQHYNQVFCNNYFWRTYDQQEIDLIEEYEGRLHAYEFKWGNKKV